MTKFIPSRPAWRYPDTRKRTLTAKQLKWFHLCHSHESLHWLHRVVNPHNDDKPPPLPWSDQLLIGLAATLIHEGKSETLRALLITLLYDDLVELIDSRRK